MTISREPDGVTLQCDHCLDLHDETFMTFGAAIRWVLLSAWVCETPDEGETWEHRCPECIPGANGRLAKAEEMFGVVKN